MDRYLLISADCHAGRILGSTAAEVYGFDADELAPIAARIGPEKRALAG